MNKKNTELRSNNNVVFSCSYHVVFCPKRRKKVLVGGVAEKLHELIGTTCSELKIDLLAKEVMPDHVHLAIGVDPQFGVHRAIKHIKGRSSRVLRKEFPELKKLPTLWTNSYFVSTVGNVSKNKVLEYIKSQWQK